MAEKTKERLSSASQQRHAARQKARKELFLKGPVTFNWMCSHIPDATSRLILVAKAFVDIEDSARIKLTRKHWECAGITDKDTRSRVIAKIKHECPGILLDTNKAVAHTSSSNAYDRKLSRHCLLYTSPSPRDATLSRMPSSA